jgi:serine phosphatase RsbU (regulator of sigma subunit)
LDIASIMCVPLLGQESEALGVIQLDTQDRRRKFDADDMQILASVANQASISVEYAQFHREMIRHARIQKELDVARAVQHSFLPKKTPELEGYRFWAHYQAAGQVGGDFYDFLRLPNRKQVVLIGDVAGKGVPAALMMAKMSGLCKVALLSHPDDVAEAMATLNRDVCDAGLEFGLVTLLLCVIEPEAHQISVASAGHITPMFRRRDATIDEQVGKAVLGFPLGFDPQSSYPTEQTQLAPGESVLLFSDGISEAMNAARELYSADRIRGQLAQAQQAGPAEIGQALLDDVAGHVAGHEQHDDITLVVFQRDTE